LCERTANKLATGALSATLHGDHLHDLRINGVAAVERIYPTVRGIQWQTSTLEHHKVHVDIFDDGFVAHVASVHRIDRARIRCTLELRGSDSTIDVKATFTAVMVAFDVVADPALISLNGMLVPWPTRATYTLR
jgi:hypothetical protein